MSPIEYRVVTLENAPVADLSWTLQGLLRSRGADWLAVGIDYNRSREPTHHRSHERSVPHHR